MDPVECTANTLKCMVTHARAKNKIIEFAGEGGLG